MRVPRAKRLDRVRDTYIQERLKNLRTLISPDRPRPVPSYSSDLRFFTSPVTSFFLPSNDVNHHMTSWLKDANVLSRETNNNSFKTFVRWLIPSVGHRSPKNQISLWVDISPFTILPLHTFKFPLSLVSEEWIRTSIPLSRLFTLLVDRFIELRHRHTES